MDARQSAAYRGALRTTASTVQRSVALTSPNAQVWTFIVTRVGTSLGTLTAAGPKPSPQQPVKIALAISVPLRLLRVHTFALSP